MRTESSVDDRGHLWLAIGAVWLSIALSALVAVVNAKRGTISQGEFMADLAIYGLLCIVPYKLQRRSNAARYVYLVLSCAGTLYALGGGSFTSRMDEILGWLWVPINFWTLYVMFLTPEASQFGDRVGRELDKR